MTLAEFLQTVARKAMSGPTGGIQGIEGTFFGMPYSPGSFLDLIHEAFAGPHDFIGGTLSTAYDDQGNARRGRTPAERAFHETWTVIALLPAAPFALAEILPPEAWTLVDTLLNLKK